MRRPETFLPVFPRNTLNRHGSVRLWVGAQLAVQRVHVVENLLTLYQKIEWDISASICNDCFHIAKYKRQGHNELDCLKSWKLIFALLS